MISTKVGNDRYNTKRTLPVVHATNTHRSPSNRLSDGESDLDAQFLDLLYQERHDSDNVSNIIAPFRKALCNRVGNGATDIGKNVRPPTLLRAPVRTAAIDELEKEFHFRSTALHQSETLPRAPTGGTQATAPVGNRNDNLLCLNEQTNSEVSRRARCRVIGASDKGAPFGPAISAGEAHHRQSARIAPHHPFSPTGGARDPPDCGSPCESLSSPISALHRDALAIERSFSQYSRSAMGGQADDADERSTAAANLVGLNMPPQGDPSSTVSWQPWRTTARSKPSSSRPVFPLNHQTSNAPPNVGTQSFGRAAYTQDQIDAKAPISDIKKRYSADPSVSHEPLDATDSEEAALRWAPSFTHHSSPPNCLDNGGLTSGRTSGDRGAEPRVVRRAAADGLSNDNANGLSNDNA
eukprot:Selendium_serpulae@DN6383_c0_g2_i9.p1